MARIELRDANIILQDGLSGTALVNDSSPGALAAPATTTSVQGVAATTDEVQVVEQYAVNFTGGTFTLTFDLNVVTGDFTTAAIAYNAGAAAIETAIDVAATLAGVTGWANGDISVTATGTNLTDGDITLTFDGGSVDELNHGQTTLNGSGLTSNALTGDTSLTIDTVSLNTADTDLVPIGARFTVAGEPASPIHLVTGRTGNPTTSITFTPAIAGGGVFNNAVITFLPQRIAVKIGDGNLTYDITREMNYELDRGNLDTVREGDQQPLEVSLDLVYENVTTGTSQDITPYDALNQLGSASEWVSSSDDDCEPYAVDIIVEHATPCGTNQDERTTLPDFRYEQLSFDIDASTISATGRCNSVLPEVERLSL